MVDSRQAELDRQASRSRNACMATEGQMSEFLDLQKRGTALLEASSANMTKHTETVAKQTESLNEHNGHLRAHGDRYV